MGNLCAERLLRLRRVLRAAGGPVSVRDLKRTYGLYRWEIEEAECLGWVKCFTRKPAGRGRPSLRVELCGLRNAKLPPSRAAQERALRHRHRLFAMLSVTECVFRGSGFLGLPGVVSAYLKVYRPRSRDGAYVSTSRLLRRKDIRAMREWFFAKVRRDIPREEAMPSTVSGILGRLERGG